MLRSLCILLLFLCALPAFAQSLFADPTVWASVSWGRITWAQGVDLEDHDNIISNFSVAVASPHWMTQGGAQISGNLQYFDWDDDEHATFRSIYAMGGPWTASEWFMGGVAVGPALTWGTDIREIRSPSCPLNEPLCINDFPILEYEHSRYVSPGLAGSVQGFVRLDGRVWLGGETMLVANTSSTHLASRLAVRVDLLRPER